MSLEQALKRPDNYNSLSASEQWAIDKSLGILDWEPTAEEIVQYKLLTSKAVECRLCGSPTQMKGTKLCDRCWELETRIKANVILAKKIIASLEKG